MKFPTYAISKTIAILFLVIGITAIPAACSQWSEEEQHKTYEERQKESVDSAMTRIPGMEGCKYFFVHGGVQGEVYLNVIRCPRSETTTEDGTKFHHTVTTVSP